MTMNFDSIGREKPNITPSSPEQSPGFGSFPSRGSAALTPPSISVSASEVHIPVFRDINEIYSPFSGRAFRLSNNTTPRVNSAQPSRTVSAKTSRPPSARASHVSAVTHGTGLGEIYYGVKIGHVIPEAPPIHETIDENGSLSSSFPLELEDDSDSASSHNRLMDGNKVDGNEDVIAERPRLAPNASSIRYFQQPSLEPDDSISEQYNCHPKFVVNEPKPPVWRRRLGGIGMAMIGVLGTVGVGIAVGLAPFVIAGCCVGAAILILWLHHQTLYQPPAPPRERSVSEESLVEMTISSRSGDV